MKYKIRPFTFSALKDTTSLKIGVGVTVPLIIITVAVILLLVFSRRYGFGKW